MKVHDGSNLFAVIIKWFAHHQVAIHAVGLSMLISVVRVVYGGGRARQIALESVLCGLVTVAIIPLLEVLGLPQSMASFVGGCVGFIGVDKLREIAIRFAKNKAGK